ncbi:hypothetical protein EV696_101298 [Permianibacter aggregans]|uniref:Uncharacterized protein n=1 Tax=Permianibacter aggregans TaxID=1510150 RepID=A0A4R6V569_9GAMM|nr:hypothetical protein EV696_101298 [Permianibacter aggregans]
MSNAGACSSLFKHGWRIFIPVFTRLPWHASHCFSSPFGRTTTVYGKGLRLATGNSVIDVLGRLWIFRTTNSNCYRLCSYPL